MRFPIGRNYVRVCLGQRLYTYYCPGARVGDVVEVPPNRYVAWPQRVRVEALGRRYFGRIRRAERVA